MEEARFAGVESGKREKLKVKNTKRYVQPLSKVSEWLSKMKKMFSLCLCGDRCPKCGVL